LSDPVLPGWTIQLYNASNNVLFRTNITDSKGVFVFNNIPPGTYILKEVQQSGWKQTAPAGGSYTIVVTENAYIFTGRDFGNQQAPVVRPCECPTQAIFAYTALKTPLHTIQFTDKSTGYPVSWLWKFGDGKISTSRNPKHTYSRRGTFTVTLAVMSYDCAGKSRWSYYTKSISVP
jgi:PKD repeat protein